MGPVTFSKHEKLAAAEEFGRVFRSSIRFSCPEMQCVVARNARRIARLGIVIGRKRIKRAVDRNRIKRLIREQFRSHKFLLKGLDVVVVANTPLARATNRSLAALLTHQFQRITEYNGCTHTTN